MQEFAYKRLQKSGMFARNVDFDGEEEVRDANYNQETDKGDIEAMQLVPLASSPLLFSFTSWCPLLLVRAQFVAFLCVCFCL